MDDRTRFIYNITESVARDGGTELLAWLGGTDFYTAPASTKYHLAREGGLVRHSLNVFDRLEELAGDLYPQETVAVTALLHDICKADIYKPEWRNQKVYAENGSKRDEGGRFDWQTVRGWSVDDRFLYGHGEKSQLLAARFLKLSDEESMAIRWHMGPYEGERHWNTVSAVFEKYPLAFYLHQADMQATYLDEVER